MLCRASLTSPTLGVALKRWCRHHRLLTEDILHTLRVEGDVAELALVERRDLGPMREFCLVTSLRFVLGYACWLIDSRIPLLESGLAFAPPSHADVYPLLFAPGPVQFEAGWTGYRFDARYLSLPPRREERALRTMLQRALPLTVLKYRRDRLLTQRVREHLHRGALSATALADGSFVVGFRSMGAWPVQATARFQVFNADGSKEGAEQVLTTGYPSMTFAAHGTGFIAAWSSNYGAYTELFAADGTQIAQLYGQRTEGTPEQ